MRIHRGYDYENDVYKDIDKLFSFEIFEVESGKVVYGKGYLYTTAAGARAAASQQLYHYNRPRYDYTQGRSVPGATHDFRIFRQRVTMLAREEIDKSKAQAIKDMLAKLRETID